jgi:hypothetical protein
MVTLKIRLFALLLMAAGCGLVYYNWYQARHEGRYYLKQTVFSPLIVIGGLYLLIFPTRIGKPATTGEKVMAMSILGCGVAAGLVNWYLLDSGMLFR